MARRFNRKAAKREKKASTSTLVAHPGAATINGKRRADGASSAEELSDTAESNYHANYAAGRRPDACPPPCPRSLHAGPSMASTFARRAFPSRAPIRLGRHPGHRRRVQTMVQTMHV